LALIGLPVALTAAPASAATQWLASGFNLDRTVDTSSVVPNPTNFVFLAGTNNFVAIGKCGQIGLGKMPNADGLSSTPWTKIAWPGQSAVPCAPTDRGLLGIDVDAGTTTVYLLYNYTPAGGSCLDGSSPIAGRIYGRLTTLTMDSATTPSSFSNERVLMN